MVTLQNAPIVKAQMLIRRPAAEVFEAFVNPNITTQFWFTKSSGRLEPGKKIQWDWEMYGVSARITVKAVEQSARILIEWDDPPCPVEWKFTPRADNTTLVTISNWGFSGSEDEVIISELSSISTKFENWCIESMITQFKNADIAVDFSVIDQLNLYISKMMN
jgi:uncharacterized protein YndB with AHSA1/START domain